MREHLNELRQILDDLSGCPDDDVQERCIVSGNDILDELEQYIAQLETDLMWAERDRDEALAELDEY